MAIPAYQIIPNVSDIPSQSQSAIQSNFTAIQGLVDVDHVDFSDGVNYGKHNKVTFPVQGTAPTFAAGEVGLYNLLPISSPITGVDELYINKQNSAAAVQIPMTASILSTNSSPAAGSGGWTYLPSGILLKWATVSGISVNATGSISFSTSSSMPVFNGLINVICTQYFASTPTAGAVSVATGNYSATKFYIYPTSSGSGTISVAFLAIGY
jgi:hypothetical protein